MFVSPENSCVEILTPSVIVSEGGDLGGDKVMKVEPSPLSPVKTPVCEPKRGLSSHTESARISILDFQSPEL